MGKRKTKSDWLRESDEWDKKSFEEILAESEPTDIRFVDARPKKAISMRLDEGMIDAGKQAAKDLGLGYQTLFRMWLIEGLGRHRRRELEARRRPRTATRKSSGVSGTRKGSSLTSAAGGSRRGR